MMSKVDVCESEHASCSEVVAFWRPSLMRPVRPAVDLIFPLDGVFSHNVFDVHRQSGARQIEAGFLYVAPRARGNGVGERLVRGLGAIAEEYAFPKIFVGLASQYSLDIFERVFGRDRMTFYGYSSGALNLNSVTARDQMKSIDISFEQVRAVLVGLEQAEKDLEHRMIGFPATVELDGLDMSAWSLTRELNKENVDIDPILLE